MSEWKELDINNIPSDILVGDYEFRHSGESFSRNSVNVLSGLEETLKLEGEGARFFGYEYRKSEPKAPTHEEIMTKWWKISDGSWHRVVGYYPGFDKYVFHDSRVQPEFFTGRESADIPPEVE